MQRSQLKQKTLNEEIYILWWKGETKRKVYFYCFIYRMPFSKKMKQNGVWLHFLLFFNISLDVLFSNNKTILWKQNSFSIQFTKLVSVKNALVRFKKKRFEKTCICLHLKRRNKWGPTSPISALKTLEIPRVPQKNSFLKYFQIYFRGLFIWSPKIWLVTLINI